MQSFYLLKTNSLPGDIDIHSDILSVVPSALSRKRALKAGRERQDEMNDKRGPKSCILCDPSLKPPGTSEFEEIIPERCGDFLNDFPYLPGDQRVVFMWNSDKAIREKMIHRSKLSELEKLDLFWLLKGCIKRGNEYRSQRGHTNKGVEEDLLRKIPDQMRMVVGFNFGRLAGQSIPHFHAQYGWEVVLNPRSISDNALNLYFEELRWADLIIHETDKVRIVAPWTPMGQYALDMYFIDKYDICEITDEDLKIFATVGHAVVQKYLSLGIQNLNIVFTNSPDNKKIEPLMVHFVPRVNMTALYEIRGVNVVDTPPSKIAEEFKRYTGGETKEINWVELVGNASLFDPDEAYNLLTSNDKTGTTESNNTKKEQYKNKRGTPANDGDK
ncbi:MAG: hypothetical protein KKC76_12060 [Proteobacteria bacterium]|nr:hypothetical protein [Pseudomonadota bacterium]MBU4295274.1 hypothetical protein [Pseudomonadota bacterium]MCG2748129.1 hypothetical protein [Desulfobulbaceae bacterium]